jgi:hypothetical protein
VKEGVKEGGSEGGREGVSTASRPGATHHSLFIIHHSSLTTPSY